MTDKVRSHIFGRIRATAHELLWHCTHRLALLLTRFCSRLKRATRKDVPVIKDTLREGLATSVGAEISCESKGLVDREVGLDDKHGGAYDLRLLKDMTTTTG